MFKNFFTELRGSDMRAVDLQLRFFKKKKF